MKKKPKRIRLTAAQSRSWIQFNYYSFEKPKLTFEQVALKVLGRNPFPHTPQGRKFKQECRTARFLIGSERYSEAAVRYNAAQRLFNGEDD